MGEVKKDLDKFFRRLKLKWHFSSDPENELNYNTQSQDSEESDTEDDRPLSLRENLERRFKIPSTWTPPCNDVILNAYINAVTTDFYGMQPQNPKYNNLKKSEQLCLESLVKRSDITIKKADKGSAIVVMNTVDYIQEANSQLSDDKFYVKTPTDYTENHKNEIKKVLRDIKGRGGLTEKTYEGLVKSVTESRTARFYFLPKILKSIIKGRPIISGTKSPTEKISEFVDEHIKQFVPKIRSYIRDTPHFIKEIENFTIDGPCLLVTMDVTSLYPNIPNHEGMVAVAQTLFREDPDYDISKQDLLLLLKLVLHKNNFEFNGEHYLQVGGTAMGTKLAPSYANIFMAKIEEDLLRGSPYRITFWKRFIDDIFFIFPYSERDLEEFMKYVNNFHPNIKFTETHSPVSVVMLDTKVIREGNGFITDLHVKETDTHSYLHYTSSHSEHCVKNGPKGQFLRLRRNCSRDIDFEKHAEDMTQNYMRRGYPEDLLLKHKNFARSKNHGRLIEETGTGLKKKRNTDRQVLVLTYNPGLPKIIESVRQHWPLLQRSERCKEIFRKPPLLAYRRAKNMKDMLVRASIKRPRDDTYSIQTECGGQNCALCQDIRDQSTEVINHRTGKPVPTRTTDVSCTTMNVVYLLTCPTCGKQYVGETKREFRIRYNEHVADIKHKRKKTVAQHWCKPHHENTGKPRAKILSVIQGNPETTKIKRQNTESRWVHNLRTIAPWGINQKK